VLVLLQGLLVLLLVPLLVSCVFLGQGELGQGELQQVVEQQVQHLGQQELEQVQGELLLVVLVSCVFLELQLG